MTAMSADLRVCANCGEENPARAKFCLECGTPFELDLVDQLPQQASGGERRHVSVLFADLSGFTSFSEQTDVEDVRAIARETADRLSEIVDRYGGTVDKIIGDCVMAVWGAPSSHEDDTERAVRAAFDMQEHTKEHAERFAGMGLSIGVNTGEAIWAPVGGSYTVLGDTVNTAARLQGAAAKGEILVGADTYGETQDAVEYEALEPIKMKNKREPVAAFRPVRLTGETRRRRTRSIPIVGRSDEQERLWELWERARTEGGPYGSLVTGAAGVGKTRLVQALVDEVGRGATVLRGACLPYGEGITYWPLAEIVRQVGGEDA
ncbi:MAG: adenylate/guanylate cyclase domain-containing protein, partial [Candidatus Binatia bacterium]